MKKNNKFISLVFYAIFSCLFIFSWFFLSKQADSASPKITILFTGQTHGSLYHCNCPIEPDGGVARRATLIAELRKKHSNVILVDSGNFFAGGLMDEYTQNTKLDMERSKINLKAMEAMKYDAVAISDDEFNFGEEFFKESVANSSLNFLSANIKAEKVLPYIIKETSGIRVGIIGLTNHFVKQKATGLSFNDPKESLKKIVDEIKPKTDVLILLANLNEDALTSLLKDVEGIDIVVAGYKKNERLTSNINSTSMVFPAWQGRRLGILSFVVSDKSKVTSIKSDMLRVSDKIKDDSKIMEFLPRCFSDANCKEKEAIGNCINPGTKEAKCEFPKPSKAKLIVISSKDCFACDTEKALNFIKASFPGINVTFLNYPDTKSEKLIKDLGIKGLPAFILNKDIKEDKSFANFKQFLLEKQDYFLVDPSSSGIAYFINREKKKGSVELFIGLFEKDSDLVLDSIREFNPQVHFLAIEKESKFEAAKGALETEEYLRSVCIKKYYPEAFWGYITCRAKNNQSSWWDNCLASGIDASLIKTCATGKEGENLLKENIALNKELQVMLGPTYLVDNREIFSTQGVPTKEDFRKIFKK